MRFVIFLLLLSNAVLSNARSSRAGQDRALFFAVEDYAYMPALGNPRQNAQDIATELKEHYGFEVEVIANPTIDEIDKTLSEYAARYADGTYPAQGQLFLFFSGHGVQEGRNGYFMASDSDPGRPQRTAMEYDYYRSQIDQINCQHILVAIDACHSATFDPNHGLRNDNRRFRRKGEAAYDRILANHQSYRARCFWTSDGLGEETPDRSTFAYQILEGLRSHPAKSGYLRSSELFSVYIEKAAPLPGGGNFGSDEPASCFLFFQTASNVIDDRTAWQQARDTDTAPAYRQYLQQYPNGDFRSLAENRLAELEAEERELLAWETAKRTHNREAYQNFIDAYPNSLYRELAEHQRDGLTFMPSNMVLIKGGTFQMGSTEGGSNEKPSTL